MASGDRRYAAYHEAGHAIVAHALGREIVEVSIVPRDRDRGRRVSRDALSWRAWTPDERWHHAIAVLVAGVMAAGRASTAEIPESVVVGGAHDLEQAVEIVRLKGEPAGSSRYERVMEIGCPIAHEVLEARWPVVEALAQELLQHPRIRGARVIEIIQAELA